MSFDALASMQRIQQLQQAQAASGDRLVLQRADTNLDKILGFIAFVLAIPTLSISLWLFSIYFIIKSLVQKTVVVKNVATGEKFKVNKEEFKKYKKERKSKENEVRSIMK